MYRFIKYITAALLLSFMLMTPKAKAHSVQVGYCVNCAGDLRLWIEHWHGTASPSTTTMTLQLNVGGIITNITASPDTSVVNVPIGSLPGCFTPLQVIAACSGTGIYVPNTHNDWVAYDFNNLPCGVNIEVTVISGNNAFTMDCAQPVPMFPASTGIFQIPCSTTAPDIDTCAGNVIGPLTFPTGNTWTSSNPAIGLGASGNGDIPAFVGANVATTQVSTITVTNTCGVSTFTITIQPAPISSFTALVGCPGQPVTFQDNSSALAGPITNWLWEYGDSSPNDVVQNPPAHTFPPGPGPYMVTLTTTTANGCTNDTTMAVYPMGGLVAGFYAASVCDGAATLFMDTTNGVITQYKWDFDGDNIVDDITQNPSHVFPGPGTYNVKLHVDAQGGCEDSITIPIIVNPNPVAAFTATDVCFPDINTFTDNSTVTPGATYAWDFGDAAGTSALQNPTYGYAFSGNYTVLLTLTSDSGCVDTVSAIVGSNDVPTALFTTNDVCSNSPAVFTDNSTGNGGTINSWKWDFDGDNIVDNFTQNPNYLFPVVGVQNVKLVVTTSAGCSDSITLPVTILAYPTADFISDPICVDSTSMFTDLSTPNGGALLSWDWKFGDGNLSAIQNPINLYISSGTYNVQLVTTSTDGCSDTIIKPVTIHPKPEANFDYSPVPTTTYEPEVFFNDLSQSDIATWQWDLGDGGSSNLQNPIHEYADSGSYPVILYVQNIYGCKDTIVQIVRIDPVFVMFIPNVFTPDGDGLNEGFYPTGYGYTDEDYQFYIFDRWGEMLFESHKPDQPWYGDFKGTIVQEGTYVYKVHVKDVHGEEHDYTGKVSIIK